MGIPSEPWLRPLLPWCAAVLVLAAGCLVSFDREFDFDHDGYTSSQDCDDSDDQVHPGADDDCEPDIDMNCDGVIQGCDNRGDDDSSKKSDDEDDDATPTHGDDDSSKKSDDEDDDAT